MKTLEYINSLQKFGSVLGLDNIKYLLSLLGNPQDSLKVIHIAGTNGKGSVSSFVSNILKEAGYTVGLYISPFVDVFNERISINGSYISDDDLDRYTDIVREKVEIMVAEGKQHPTEFEIITAVGFLYFLNKNVDVVVLEVGLGGRLDATNIIDSPLLSVIT